MSSSLMSSGKERLSVAGISPSTVTLYAPSDLALFDIPRRLIPEPIEIGALIEIKITRDVEAEDDDITQLQDDIRHYLAHSVGHAISRSRGCSRPSPLTISSLETKELDGLEGGSDIHKGNNEEKSDNTNNDDDNDNKDNNSQNNNKRSDDKGTPAVQSSAP
eukprot:GEMP01082129.1.p1 GENE.GEMP01082129.1~~GEMP01082129.1.p1  ORF type:complete len:162 (+),score=29.54 GEMP01082129.1:236-721(+)